MTHNGNLKTVLIDGWFKTKNMINLKVIFNTTSSTQDITEYIQIPNDVCYCLYDKDNKFYNEIKKALECKGYKLKYYFNLIKVRIL